MAMWRRIIRIFPTLLLLGTFAWLVSISCTLLLVVHSQNQTTKHRRLYNLSTTINEPQRFRACSLSDTQWLFPGCTQQTRTVPESGTHRGSQIMGIQNSQTITHRSLPTRQLHKPALLFPTTRYSETTTRRPTLSTRLQHMRTRQQAHKLSTHTPA